MYIYSIVTNISIITNRLTSEKTGCFAQRGLPRGHKRSREEAIGVKGARDQRDPGDGEIEKKPAVRGSCLERSLG